MSHDSITTVGNSLIQKGSFNDRIYLMSLSEQDMPEIVDDLIKMATTEDFSKIFAKIPNSYADSFISNGFEKEAVVPGLFAEEDGMFLSFYRYPWRKRQGNKVELDQVLSVAETKKGKGNVSTLPSTLTMRRLDPLDVDALTRLYDKTFETYPFPITDPDFIGQEMADGVRFMGVFEDDVLVGAASAEISSDGYSAEMTDFAVNPDYRKMGIAGALLRALEEECCDLDIKCCFTIARACSHGINSLFSKGDYSFSGRLINNTNISGSLESMNVWYKSM